MDWVELFEMFKALDITLQPDLVLNFLHNSISDLSAVLQQNELSG